MRSSTETRTIFTHQWLHEEGATPLLRAAQSGDLTLVDLLLEHGADPTLATDDGTTALMVAAGIGWVEGVTYEWSPARTLETVKRLLDLELPVNAQNLDGQTALMGAAHKGRKDVVELLVERGADLALRDIGSRDTIHVLAGLTWQAIDYADGLVRVGVQSAIPHPETATPPPHARARLTGAARRPHARFHLRRRDLPVAELTGPRAARSHYITRVHACRRPPRCSVRAVPSACR
jgi:hypothetical protein